ncbi:beta-N-acetylhexosaminidase [Purpureocillium lavendulum]|uniref:Beta-N-acetylhexosaminidase n=1 Tax=Purpureocillium lavendulum TaxID=1247861 RepID=A0AB34FK41_9HYPO|nr:beta-N-acetylhexosaminidase [Purpureocillium lavendulum]
MVHLYRAACLWALLVSAQARSDRRDDASSERGLPQVLPTPQQITSTGCGISLKGAVTIVTGNATDKATIDAVKAVVHAAGGQPSLSSHATGHGTQILIGTEADNSDAAAAAKLLTGDSAKGLDPDGYVLATGKYNKQPTVVLNGVDTRGTFYATQTLRQLADGRHGVPGVKVRDWPLMSIRGSIEGFYGVPWSHQARLDQYVFYGKHKMNTYIYTPKSDPLLRDSWRNLYNSSDLEGLKELVDTAVANHVDFTFALSPGLDLCYSSDDDFNTTVTKFDQVRALGVSSFYIALDDIPLKFHCDSDKQRWPDKGDWHWIADAQAYYLNRVQTEYVEKHDLKNLQTVPTNYAGSQPDPYKEEFGTQLNKNVSIQWTGEGVFSPNVTVESVVRADSTYVTDRLYFWDNFPVNDGKTNRLFLNPLTGRDADLYKHLLGFTSNPMVQSYASMIALANYGDYTWNGPKYDADASAAAAVWELAGSDKKVHEALVAFVDINQNWPYRTPTVNAPQLSKDIAAFWAARKGSSSSGKDGAKALRDRLALLTTLPKVLPRLAMKGFATDTAPWSTLAMQWATACQHLVAMLDALDHGDKNKATKEFNTAQEWVNKTKAKTVSGLNDDGEVIPDAITPVTGDGAFDTFLANATTIYKG